MDQATGTAGPESDSGVAAVEQDVGDGAGVPELTGRDRFPGGADPLFSPTTHRRMAKVGEFAFNVVGFGLVTTLLAVWWGDETFNVLAVLVRGAVFATVVLAFEMWRERRPR